MDLKNGTVELAVLMKRLRRTMHGLKRNEKTGDALGDRNCSNESFRRRYRDEEIYKSTSSLTQREKSTETILRLI